MCNDHFWLHLPSVEPLTHGRIVLIGSPRRRGLRAGRASRVMLTDVQCDSSEEDEAHIRFLQQDAMESWVPPGPISRTHPVNRWQSAHPLRDIDASNRKRGHCASDEHHQPEGAEAFEVHPDHVLFFQIDDMPSGSSPPLPSAARNGAAAA